MSIVGCNLLGSAACCNMIMMQMPSMTAGECKAQCPAAQRAAQQQRSSAFCTHLVQYGILHCMQRLSSLLQAALQSSAEMPLSRCQVL